MCEKKKKVLGLGFGWVDALSRFDGKQPAKTQKKQPIKPVQSETCLVLVSGAIC